MASRKCKRTIYRFRYSIYFRRPRSIRVSFMPVKLVHCAALIISILASLGCEQNTTSPVSGAGPWRLVNYWAVWCEPCREEIPVFNRLDQEHDLAVYGVNFDRLQGEALTTAINELGITFEVL